MNPGREAMTAVTRESQMHTPAQLTLPLLSKENGQAPDASRHDRTVAFAAK